MNTVLGWIGKVLETTPERWLSMAENLPPEMLVQPPKEGEWSALDCLQHLLDTERWVFPVRVKHILAGQDFPAFDPDSEGTLLAETRSGQEMAREFQQLRAESLKTLQQVTPQDMGRKALHAELGEVTMSELLHEWAGHDLMHTVQAERALMQPFIRGAGPWQGYFSDHLAK